MTVMNIGSKPDTEAALALRELVGDPSASVVRNRNTGELRAAVAICGRVRVLYGENVEGIARQVQDIRRDLAMGGVGADSKKGGA